MRWDIQQNISLRNLSKRREAILAAIYKNRNLSNPEAIDTFLHPLPPELLVPEAAGIDRRRLTQALDLIQACIDHQTPIIIYGDYDADGITATAILWETLHALGAKAIPFIPNRTLHGYGLSIKGLEDALKLLSSSSNLPNFQSTCLVITVDNGIVANEAVKWLKDRQIQVIVTDHHQPGEQLPPADVIVHTTSLCGAGVAWMIAKSLKSDIAPSTLDLVCIGTIADMMPLFGVNRSLVKFGLIALCQTSRVGLKALCLEAGIDLSQPITPYHINFAIAPRLNAMGRLEHAMDSLRLLCTRNSDRANLLAKTLADTNHNRQDLTQEFIEHAKRQLGRDVTERIIVIDHESYHEGVIGLIASKLAETYYRPTIVISRKDGVSKASARSIKGVNITELIRTQSQLLIAVGGHPMAAGFSIETDKIETFRERITKTATEFVSADLLETHLTIDCEIKLDDISEKLYTAIQTMQPFGIGNPPPVFILKNIQVISAQVMGKTGQHLKLLLQREKDVPLTALWFGHGQEAESLSQQTVNLAFTLDQNTWRNKTTLQIMIKDVQVG